MDIPEKRLACGFSLPALGFGTWQMGGRDKRDPQNDDDADIRAIRNAVDLGITHIDTAEFYAEGHAERLVAKALRGMDRSRFILTTKVTPMHFHSKDLIRALHGSLKRLGTDYIDVYLLHAPNPYIPIEETMGAMDLLVQKKLIRAIGLSNYDVGQFRQAQACTQNKIVCNHLHYNIKHRLCQKDGSLRHAQENDVMVVAWRPLQKGLFCTERDALIDKVAEKYQKTPNQVAINWLLSQKNVVTITKCRSIDHLQENLGALGWEMEKEDRDLIDRGIRDICATADTATLTDKIRPE